MYMSYCRFEGTLAEMRACMQDVEDHANGEAGEAVSDREIRSFRNMVNEFVGFLRDMAILDDEGYVDEDELNAVCESMGKASAE